jgi:hypothetical protein
VAQIFFSEWRKQEKGRAMDIDHVKDHEAAYKELQRLLVNATPRERRIAAVGREEGICARAVYELKKREREALRKPGQATPFVWQHLATLPQRTEEERKKYDPRYNDAVD